MKKILVSIGILFFMSSCLDKPVIPGKKHNHVHISNNKTKNRNFPVKPHEIIEDDKSVRILSPSQIFERFSPAVFKIFTSTGYNAFQGSGFFISNDGVAVSNYHVFKGTAIGYETIILADGSQHKVSEVYHKDEEYDFIVFKVDLINDVSYIKIASKIPKVGEKIYTIGSPRGLDNTFSSGEVSQIRDNGTLLQISAPIDHGSSGGVLLNNKGEAVGITSGGFDDSGANLNFARNINLVKPYIP